jgi:Tol biopolymer transport system component
MKHLVSRAGITLGVVGFAAITLGLLLKLGTTSSVTPLASMSSSTSLPAVAPVATNSLRPELKVVYQEYRQGVITVSAASVITPELRTVLAKVEVSPQSGGRVSLSRDGTKIAYTVLPDGNGNNLSNAELWVIDLSTSLRQKLTSRVDLGRYVDYPIWSPDNQWIAFDRQTAILPPFTQTIAVVNVVSGEERTLHSADDTTWQWLLEWSPDSRYLYYVLGMAPAQLWRLDVVQGSAQLVGPIPGVKGMMPRCYYISPDGQYLLCTVLEKQAPASYSVIIVPTTESSQTEVIASGGTEDRYNPIWGPGTQAVTINSALMDGQPAELQRISIQDRQISVIAQASQSLLGIANGIFEPEGWSPDGQWIAAGRFPESEPGGMLVLINTNGSQVRRISAQGALQLLGWTSAELPSVVR